MSSYDHITPMTLSLDRWITPKAPKPWEIERDEGAGRDTAPNTRTRILDQASALAAS